MLLRRLKAVAVLAALVLLVFLLRGNRWWPPPPTRVAPVRTGIDVLAADGFALLAGKRVGLITNQTGRTRDGRRTVDLLAAAPEVKLVALFSPEHGVEGVRTGRVEDDADAATGLRVYSLYGQTRRPTEEMLDRLDALVFDIQDAGVRYYTYVTTMGYAMEEAARRGIEVVVLDRPNPLNGRAVEGPVLDADRLSFEGYFPLPLRHGMTLGELARLFNREKKIGARLTVVPMAGWRREQWFDQAGLEWVNPSPNLRSLAGNTFYPAVELLRAGGVSVGRGTGTPFELFGAPWIDADQLAQYLNRREIPGVRFEPLRYHPPADVHADQDCRGVRLVLTDRGALDVGRLGVELLAALHRFYPQDFKLAKTIRLLGSARTLARLEAGDDPKEIATEWDEALAEFRKLRALFLLYD